MPDRPQSNRGASFETLFEAPTPAVRHRGAPLPDALRRYGDRFEIPLRPDRPTVLVNFVESLDGVVTFDPEHGSGGEVSGFNEPDRFVMGLLRAVADAVVVGAGTVRAAPNHQWTARRVNRDFADAYGAWRRSMGLSRDPTPIIVTSSGTIPSGHPALFVEGTEPVIVTTAAGRERLDASWRGPGFRVVVTAPDGPVAAASVVKAAADLGAHVLLCEGGPHLSGTFASEGLLDELFLTLAPQLIGRGAGDRERRYSLIEGVSLGDEEGRWARLRSVHRSVDHLFLRYAFDGG